MGSMGFQEIAVILLIALLIFGPKKLPEIGRILGETVRELRRASNEFTSSIKSFEDDDDEEENKNKSEVQS
jgi:sec-independent protein translocase protein TatA